MPDGSEIEALRAALAAAVARVANAEAKVSDAQAQITAMKLMIEKLRRELYGQRSERKQRFLNKLELQLDELEASATEDELAAERAAAGTTQVKGFTRRRPARKPFPEHLPANGWWCPRRVPLSAAARRSLEDRRGYHRDAGCRSPPLEGDPDGARKVHLPPLREDLSAAGAVPCRSPWLGRSQPARHACLREVWGPSADEPAAGPLRTRRGRPQPSSLAGNCGTPR